MDTVTVQANDLIRIMAIADMYSPWTTDADGDAYQRLHAALVAEGHSTANLCQRIRVDLRNRLQAQAAARNRADALQTEPLC